MLYPCMGRAVVQYIILGQVTKWPFKGEQSGEMQLGQMWNSVSSWIVFLGVQCVLRCAMCNSRTKQRSQRKGKSWLQSLDYFLTKVWGKYFVGTSFVGKVKAKGIEAKCYRNLTEFGMGLRKYSAIRICYALTQSRAGGQAMERDGRISLILAWPRLHSTRFPLQLWF